MAISMYQVSLPIFVRHLNGLAGCMKKAQALYAEKKYDEATLLSYRLYPDMFSFTRQVQAATDHARTCAALLAGMEAPKYEDNEKSLAELIARVEKTVAWLNTVKPEQIDGTEEKGVTVKMRDRELKFTGQELLLNRSMPNFYFHTTTAYDIIRHNGVEIGKRDFMGAS
ncbi:MAG: hypothetical protein A3G24_19690 [Betaproteobacteria bacterium RIFCSPLOWO2_12_FULL_62_13]|nr:MAG: hypothetical protein A3G24_19690 [Betaproteobacteria bacterium RIFCSPLOWO2_12_FULL_62_13]